MREWQQILLQLEKELGAQIVQKWIPRLARFDAGNIYLEARDSFQIHWFEEHVRPRLKGLVNANQRPIKVHLNTGRETASPQQEEAKKLSFSSDPIDPEMTLENYLPPPENLVAYQLLKENAPFNPIYLYGPKGVGKTHLLMGAAIALQKQGKRPIFVRAETFTEHVVQAMRFGQMRDFRKIYRDIDALIIDDIHIFSKKMATQEEFFHTFNTLHMAGKPILLSAHVPPLQLKEIEPRLISRFEWGISLGLQEGDKRAILERKGALWKTALSQEILSFLLEKFQNPVMALQALTLRAKGESIDLRLAERLLKDLLAKEEEKVLTFDHIAKATAAHYGITVDDLLGKSQMREISIPRQIAMYLCREKIKLPYQKIGELFGRDHSTVMSSVKAVQKSLDEKKSEVQEAIRTIASQS